MTAPNVRTRTAVAAAILVGVLGGGSAWAAVSARAAEGADQAVTTSTWAAVASPATTTLTNSVPRALLTVTNTGTLPVIAVTYEAAAATLTGPATVTLSGCAGTWSQTKYTCSTGAVTLATLTATAPDATAVATGSGTFPAAPGQAVTLLLSQTGLAKSASLPVTVTPKVSRNQARAAVTTTS